MKTRTEHPEEDLCTVVFRLKKGHTDVGRFVYALACRVEQWKDVEVVSLDVGDLHYQKNNTTHSVQGDAQ